MKCFTTVSLKSLQYKICSNKHYPSYRCSEEVEKNVERVKKFLKVTLTEKFQESEKNKSRPPWGFTQLQLYAISHYGVFVWVYVVWAVIISLLLFSCSTFVVIFFNDFLPLLVFIELKEHCCVVKTTESYMPEDYIASFPNIGCYVFLKTAELSFSLSPTLLACWYHRYYK